MKFHHGSTWPPCRTTTRGGSMVGGSTPRQDYDEVVEEVNEMLATSPEPGAEEYAIHDYENFGRVYLSEYEDLRTVCALADGIEAYGKAFAGLAAVLDREEWERVLERFDEFYRGCWPSMVDYAAELLDDLGIDIDAIGPEILQPYVRVDLDAFADDLAYDFHVVETDEGVHLFEKD
ncbi:MAG: antirestriction protein ArdA [Acidimicrobiia bacterium]|nr:antirestriction protein ArdA [Acidimicrobiia bacterium]